MLMKKASIHIWANMAKTPQARARCGVPRKKKRNVSGKADD
jgi:hypothetical protein